MAECAKHNLLEQIAQCEFILIDINLFLDTHPNDVRAIEDYNGYAEQLHTLKRKYTEQFGPIHNFGNSTICDENFFIWATRHFPWNQEA